MTCAHVVNAALRRDLRAQDSPSDPVIVEFPLLTVAADHTYVARVNCWLPPPRQGAAGDDIAGLRLVESTPPDAVPAVLATTAPQAGQIVDVFGYPSAPQRPGGGWVEALLRGPVGGGRLQLDGSVGTALRIQRGYSGSPVLDRRSGKVVGMLSAAPRAGADERDAYAIGVELLMSAWAAALDPAGLARRSLSGRRPTMSQLTLLHVSDTQFGKHHLFGGTGLTIADRAEGTLFRRLHADLEDLAADYGLRPDLMVITGDLAEWGLRSEFEQVLEFLTDLTEAVGLPRRHVAIVPGNHDVNRSACEAYFAAQRADEREPVAPYWPKWEHFAAAFAEFYDGVAGVSFTPDEPWSIFEMPELRVVVAGLNSTMAESHREADHYGWVGEAQLRWFADRLTDYRNRGWLRLAAVHHNVVRGAQLDDENLRDSDDLDRMLGEPSLANLLLHGHTHDARMHHLSSQLPLLSTGSTAVSAEARPQEVPNQYQLITIRSDQLTRYARHFAVGRKRWIGDTRISRTGSDWRETTTCMPTDVQATFGLDAESGSGTRPEDATADQLTQVAPADRGQRGGSDSELLDRVREATQVKYPDAMIAARPGDGYLRISDPLPDGGCAQWPIGVIDEATAEQVRAFAEGVHARFAAADPQLRSELVYASGLASEELIAVARRQGVRLRSLVDYQGLIDLRPLVGQQADSIAADRRYPSELYVPQRFRILDTSDGDIQDDILERVVSWLDTHDSRFIVLLGDFGRGKTFLLRQLARNLPGRLPTILPVLVELQGLEKAPSLDELLVQHLVRHGMETVELAKLRYMVRSGRLALLFDGFDELAMRVSYDHAADYLRTLMAAASGSAKIVLTSRTQHFESTAQVRTALGDRVSTISGSRIAVIEDFSDDQIRQFLVNRYAGDEAAALARFGLLDQIQDLLGLSHNPRMLSFIADLDETRLRKIERQLGRISAAKLYREIIDFWLVGEVSRQSHPRGLSSFGKDDRRAACTALANRLWASTAPTIPLADMSAEVSAALSDLAERGYSAEEAAQAVGSGSLLVRTGDGAFTFVHPSVMEWLVADAAANALRAEASATMLASRRLSRLMTDFLCDLAGPKVVSRWADSVLARESAPEIAKQNALDVRARLDQISGGDGDHVAPRLAAELAGMDLRGQDLTRRDLSVADLRNAVFRGMRLVDTDFTGADLRGADFTGARLTRVRLDGAIISNSRWSRSALIDVTGLDRLLDSDEIRQAAIVGRDLAEVVLSPRGAAACLDISRGASEGESILAVGKGNAVELIDLLTGSGLRVLTGHTGVVHGVAFSPDGTLLATTSADGTARIWDTATGQPRTTVIGPGGTLLGVALSPDGTLLATASRDGTARIWDTATGQPRTTLTGHTSWVNGVAFSPDGTLLATTSADGTARIWETATGQPRTALTGHTSAVTGVTFSPDGTLLATASADGTARIWDTATGQPRTALTGHTSWVTGVAFSPDGTLLATASRDGTARIWDTATGQPRTALTGHTSAVTGVAFSPAGTLLATTAYDGTARIWDTATGQPRTTVTGHVSGMTGVAFPYSGTLLATAAADSTARIWDTATGQLRTTVTSHVGAVTGVAISPDGTLLATASADSTARIWDTATGQPRTTVTGHTSAVTGVTFSPDGTLLATASRDGTARIWDTATGQPRITLNSHSDGVKSQS